METISCDDNHSSYPTGVKSTNYVEANVLRMYAKFQLHPPYGFCEDANFFFFFKNVHFMSPRQPIKVSNLGKRRMKRGVLLNKHICEIQIPPIREHKRSISTFPHYKSMRTVSCYSNQSSYSTGIKKHHLCRG